jgi:hypothetical protein
MPWRRMNSFLTKDEQVFTEGVENTKIGDNDKKVRKPLIGIKNGLNGKVIIFDYLLKNYLKPSNLFAFIGSFVN